MEQTPNPYPSPGSMTYLPSFPAVAYLPSEEQKALIEAENNARHLFANDPTNPQLNDPHLLLMNVFDSPPGTFDYTEETPEEKRVPKLLTQSRQLDLKGSAIVDKPTFLKNWTEFTQGCLDGLDFTNIFVAGGAVLGCLSSNQDGYRSSDVDLFLHGITSEEEANQKVRSIYRQIVTNTKGKGDVIRTARALTILCTYPFRHIQIILRLYRSPAEVLLGFDIDSCCVGFDGTDVWCQQRLQRALTKRFNLTNKSRRSLTYESRLYKYSKRGFCVAVPDLDKSRINTALFHKEIRDVSGLARLVLFDYKQGSGKSTFSRLSKEKKSIDMAEGSDYNNDLPIPWGPEWQTDVIINLLHAKNKANFYSSLRKNGQEKEPENSNYNHLFTSDAATLANGFDQWKRSIDGVPVQKPLEWIKDNPAYQDFDNGFQRLMTGSFEPVVDKNWESEVYLPDGQKIPDDILATKPFSTDDSSIKDSAHSPSKHIGGGLPFVQTSLPTKVVAKQPKKPLPKDAASKPPPFTSSADTDPKKPLPKATVSKPPQFTSSGPDTSAHSNFGKASYGSFSASTSSQFQFYDGSSNIPIKEAREKKDSHVLSGFTVPSQPQSSPGFGPQPGSSYSFFGTQTAAAAQPAQPSPGFGPQPGMATPTFHFGAAPTTQFPSTSTAQFPSTSTTQFPSTTSHSIFGAAPAQRDTSTMTKLLLLIALCFKKQMISNEEKGKLKDLALARNELVLSAFEVFEIDQDIEELADTLRRICKFT